MTTYHVWLAGRDEPERIEADAVFANDCGLLVFYDHNPDGSGTIRRSLERAQWSRWAAVHDEADHTHI